MTATTPTQASSCDVPGPRKVAIRELLSMREGAWAPRLRRVSLVAEAETIRIEHSIQVAGALGRVYAKIEGDPDRRRRELLRWPACTAAAMVAVAVSAYEAGTYWPALWKATGYAGSAADQSVWGQAFIEAVGRLGMPAFPEMPLRYVGPITMHAGIPASCLDGYFRLLADRRRLDPGMDAESFLAWATAPGHESRLNCLNVPARRFLSQGGEYAHDVVDRSLDLLDRLGDPDPDLAGIRLPAFVIEAARRERDAGRLALSEVHRRKASSERTAKPRIGLDPFGEGVRVVLPAIGDAPDGLACWRIAADGVVDTVLSRALWVGASEAAPETTYPLPRPARKVLVSLAGQDLATELHVVDPADPILFFTDDGRQVPGSLSLPRGPVWALYPADRDLAITGDTGDASEPSVPFGWEGWRLRHLSLDHVQSICLSGGRLHVVHGQIRPRLVTGEPIPGVTTPYGSPVYAQPPRLMLPEDPGITWHVDLRPASTGPALLSQAVDGPGEVDLGQYLPRPALGAFDITVRGPLGRGMRRSVYVAEGLMARYEPGVRMLSVDGMRHCAATITAAVGATAEPASLRFTPRERSRVIEYRTAICTEPLVVSPPHMSVLCPGAGATTWSAMPLRLTTEEFPGAGRLLVRTPGGSEPPDLHVLAGGVPVQSVPASGHGSPGLAGYELARAAETVAEHGRAELVLNVTGAQVPVALVRPRRLATGASLENGQVRLVGYRPVDGLMAGIYLVHAPWRRPVIQPVLTDGVVPLPQVARAAGPLRVQLWVEDPWTTSGWPDWPGSDSFLCSGPGVPECGDEEQDLLSRFVAGHADLPGSLEHLERLWWLVHLADDLVRSGARANLTERCGEALRREPANALHALFRANLDRRSCITALIVTGMASVLPATPSSTDGLWPALPVAAAILTSPLLRVPSDDPDDPAATVTEDAIAQCGDSLRAILEHGRDPHAQVGRFAAAAERMAQLSTEQVDALWQAAAVVPQAELDADTRAVAARRLFDARRSPGLRRAARSATSAVRTAELLIRRSAYPRLTRQIAERCHPDRAGGWLALPAMSAALALVARVAARGDIACQDFEQAWREEWANLAAQAPDQASIDLILAEVLLASAEPSAAGDLGRATTLDVEHT